MKEVGKDQRRDENTSKGSKEWGLEAMKDKLVGGKEGRKEGRSTGRN